MATPAKAYPTWPMELYANNLLMFFWPIAATAPKIIEAIDIKIIIVCHSAKIFEKGININLINTAKPATFGTTAK